MPIPVTLQYFSVRSCGYYPRDDRRPAFGELGGLLEDLGAWIIGEELQIVDTKTFDADEDGTILPCYCFNIRSADDGSGLLTTWNETETLGEFFGSVAKNSTVGSARVRRSRIPVDGIPGFPAYFWFVPDRQLIVAVRVRRQRLNGHQELRRYLQGFLETASRHCVLADERNTDGSYEVRGYARDSDSPVTRYFPRFRSYPLKAPTQLDRLRRDVESISRVLMKKDLKRARTQDQGLLQNVLRQLSLPARTPTHQSVAFSADIAFRPSLEQLEAMITAYENSHLGLNDLGFRVSGNGVVWLSSSSTTRKVELDFRLDQSGIADARSLLNALETNKNTLIPPRRITDA